MRSSLPNPNCSIIKYVPSDYFSSMFQFKERYDRLALLDFDFEGKPELKKNTQFCRGVSKEQHYENRCQQLVEFKQEVGD